MGLGIYSALSGMKVKELELDMVAHNMANINTAGFKEQHFSFESVLSRYGDPDAANTSRTPYVKVKEQRINFSDGALHTTNNPLDIALEGDGFFEIQTNEGNFYTRSGSFSLNEKGELVTTQGHRVLGKGGPILLGEGSKVDISPKGEISIDGEERGVLSLVTFDDKSKLLSAGGTLLKAPEGTTQPQVATHVMVHQGKIEQSNTNMMMGLVKMIEVSRQYQTYQKVISSQSKLEQDAASSIGRIN